MVETLEQHLTEPLHKSAWNEVETVVFMTPTSVAQICEERSVPNTTRTGFINISSDSRTVLRPTICAELGAQLDDIGVRFQE